MVYRINRRTGAVLTAAAALGFVGPAPATAAVLPTADAVAVATQVEAEDFTDYEDSSSWHSGDCGSGPVDMQVTSDTGGGCNVGWTKAGEWLEYDITTANAGTVDLALRVAAKNDGKRAQVSIDGTVAGVVTASGEGWQSWTTETISGVETSSGSHVVRVTFLDGDMNLNWLSSAELETVDPAEQDFTDGFLLSHDFDDDDMGPFVSCTTKSPNYAKAVDGRLETHWYETSYDGSRMTKGAEACGDPEVVGNDVGYLTYKHAWMGFTLNLDEGFVAENPYTQAGLAQVFGFDDSLGMSSWTALLEYTDGDLTWVDRIDMGMNRQNAVIMEDVPRDQDLQIIIHVELSKADKGTVEVYVDGDLKYSRYDANVGMGTFTDDDEQADVSYTEFKIGQYDHTDSEYVSGEERIVYYDNVSWFNGEDGYDVVDPSKG
ncbi:carbohydrate-binding domain-containing protein [Sanguibacter antarcticus]|uniref:Polysaccharide lyase-like protein n=1 Tax=Sanguibacter antarcticus TaxID=372484 RepID=A0A2A9E810_9MICO|nr:carbohydrate-binding domain-containing protein [Sanguibacter antarcticus]PFG34973.1 polysaccharide lyase-like protein [Sanguibacter antarcticus]